MANLKNVIYLTNEDYETLVTTGTVTIDGETLTYDENNLYITPNTLASPTEDGLMSAEDKAKLDGLAIENGTGTNAVQMKQDGTSGVFSFTGKNPKATEIDSTLTGNITYGATGNFATVLGGKASAQGKRSMAQGTTTIAKGAYSHAEGDNTVALGSDSHAEGYQTTASGQFAHSEGEQTLASGKGAHATGHNTIAEGEFSTAHGYYTYANQPAQYVVGTFNDLESAQQALFVVGNGTYDHLRSNALMVFKDGHAEVQTMGSTANSVATKAYVDTNGLGGTKLYKHTITTSTTTDKAVIIISENSYNVSGPTPATFASMPFISGYITPYPVAGTGAKHPILYKSGATISYYDPTAATIVSLSVNGTITDIVTVL